MINVMSPSSIITHLQSLPLSEWTGNLNLNLNLDYLLNFIEQDSGGFFGYSLR